MKRRNGKTEDLVHAEINQSLHRTVKGIRTARAHCAGTGENAPEVIPVRNKTIFLQEKFVIEEKAVTEHIAVSDGNQSEKSEKIEPVRLKGHAHLGSSVALKKARFGYSGCSSTVVACTSSAGAATGATSVTGMALISAFCLPVASWAAF